MSSSSDTYPRLFRLQAGGSFLFILLYAIAAFHYPGGWPNEASGKGYSWRYSYFCNLLSETAINGSFNTARPWALAAIAVLCTTLVVFWSLVPLPSWNRRQQRLIRAAGMGSFVLASLLALNWHHDGVINAAGLLGLVALAGVMRDLYLRRKKGLLVLGLGCLLCVVANNLLYHTGWMIGALPVVQKFSFACFLGWFLALSRQTQLSNGQDQGSAARISRTDKRFL